MTHNAETTTLPSRSFLRFAAIGAFAYVAAQLFQWVLIDLVLPTPATPEEAVLHRLMPLAQARDVTVLLSFPAVLIAYSGVALCAFRRSPGAAAIGLVFAAVFVALELAYRSIDFFVVSQQWALHLQDTADSAVAARVTNRATAWRQLVTALYFPLLLAHGLASASLGVAVWNRADRISQTLSVLLVVNAARALGRLLEIHAGVHGLNTMNARIYLPITVALFGVMSFWLWKQGDRSKQDRSATHS